MILFCKTPRRGAIHRALVHRALIYLIAITMFGY